MMEKFPLSYPTQEELAKHVGVRQNTISERIKDYETSIGLEKKIEKSKNQHYRDRDNGKQTPTHEENS
jgi:DNA-binding XRE family transcriptional regulator